MRLSFGVIKSCPAVITRRDKFRRPRALSTRPKAASPYLRNSVSIHRRSICVESKGALPRERQRQGEMGRSEVVVVAEAEKLMEGHMKGNDSSHDAWHVFRVRDLALSLAREEGLASRPDSMEIVELAALLHDIGDYKYLRDPSEEKIVENFLEEQGVEESKKIKILRIVRGMGFKNEIKGLAENEVFPEFGVVQDADRLDAIGAIGIARCFTFGGSRNRVLHDPAIQPRSDLSQECYMKKEEQTTLNHFYEKLLKLKDLMKTKAGQRRAEKRHKFMLEYLEEFCKEWDGRA
ncbi:uncharacterized protein LOC115663358 [Syzygium oleosum]|uniref:uncharacterized protein LOC115663358 n=1 Tax=Syzygium oleosum TaxID=219896 RepID=UPI0011D23D02|nr:uncharacterized protein LOC115663358 [Syzygium oleosum]XP_030441223.1 uncharacterized protein LOC115663358 [Syzygium oleosum]XP_030441224.1 uncharacterized protein LOC115663358 [Syzygium oleosum]